MKFAYHPIWLAHLHLVKEAKRWCKQGWISKDQFDRIALEYPSSLYHPNLFIRLLLFVATLLALLGVSGLLILVFGSAERTVISALCLLYGVVSWLFLEVFFVKSNHHYKSGVTEALLYHSAGFIIGGVAGLTHANMDAVLVTCILVFAFCAIRFIDLLSTLAAWCCCSYYIFHLLYDGGGLFRQVIPFAMMALFSGVYRLTLKIKKRKENESWADCFLLTEAFSLLAIYAAGNYLVVRELSVSMMDLHLADGEDIPFAWLFYFFTAAIPIAYLYFGIKKKSIVLIRVSLVVVACAVFTFKYYFSIGYHEVTLTVAGIILIGLSLWLIRYLKTPRNGYTSENILSEKWGDANLSAFVISQTLGGNQTTEQVERGGSFGGGGSTDSF